MAKKPLGFKISLVIPPEGTESPVDHRDFDELITQTPMPYDKNNLETLDIYGRGGFGQVFKVQDKVTKEVMAMKQIPAAFEDPVQKERQLLELRTLLKAHSQHITRLMGAFFDGDHICILMEPMSGGSIESIYQKCGGGIPEPYLGKIVNSIVKGIHYLKETMHVLHRDIKPANMLMNLNGKTKLSDLGIGKQLVPGQSYVKTNVGTELYLAPERIKPPPGTPRDADVPFDIRNDVWALGLSILEMAIGKFPYKLHNPIFITLNEICEAPPPQLDPTKYTSEACDFVRLCLEKDVTKRPFIKDLMKHPFMKLYDDMEVDMRAWIHKVLGRVDERPTKSAEGGEYLPGEAPVAPPTVESPPAPAPAEGAARALRAVPPVPRRQSADVGDVREELVSVREELQRLRDDMGSLRTELTTLIQEQNKALLDSVVKRIGELVGRGTG